MRAIRAYLLAVITLASASTVHAEVVALQILKHEPFAGDQSFGDVGPYDQITAIARFAVDPKDAPNRVIVDLDLAPKNKNGNVEFASDVVILTPHDPAKGNGAIFYDVNNRGNKLALGMFNRPVGGPGPDAKNPAGNGFLMRKGYTVVWSGWIGELLPGEGRLLLKPPLAFENGKPVRGIVRQETSSDKRVPSMPLSRRPNHGSYPPAHDKLDNAVLTKRFLEKGDRQVVPREQWELVEYAIPVHMPNQLDYTLPPIQLENKRRLRAGRPLRSHLRSRRRDRARRRPGWRARPNLVSAA